MKISHPQSSDSRHAPPISIGTDWLDQRRQRIRWSSTALSLIFLIFAIHSFVAFEALRMASVSLAASAMSFVAMLLIRNRISTVISANLLIAGLCVQIFGEMILNGGLNAPATPLATLIIPAAYLLCPNETRTIVRWFLLVALCLTGIGALHAEGWILPNELSLEAQRYDKLMSLLIGVICSAYLIKVFSEQANAAMKQLGDERKQFRQQALFDSLTSLPNRSHFFDHATLSLREAGRQNQSCCLIFLDIDGFKQVNDTLGHIAGDDLLRQFAQRLESQCQAECFAARLAGDEFIVLSGPADSPLNQTELLQQLSVICEMPFTINQQSHHVSFSAGFARFPDDSADLDGLINHADQRMYANKAARRASTISPHREETFHD